MLSGKEQLAGIHVTAGRQRGVSFRKKLFAEILSARAVKALHGCLMSEERHVTFQGIGVWGAKMSELYYAKTETASVVSE